MAELVDLQFDLSTLQSTRPFARLFEAPAPLPLPPGLRDDVREQACRTWEDRAGAEYVGVMVMRRLHGLLVDVNAPMDLQELALHFVLQEQQHTRLCMAAASALGSEGTLALDLEELQQERSGLPPEEELLALVCGSLATGEVAALRLISHAVKTLPESGFRELLRTIARDEVLHAELGLWLLAESKAGRAEWLPWPGDEEVQALLERERAPFLARDVVEPADAALFEVEEARAQLLALGVTPPEAFKAAFREALELQVPAALSRIGLGS